MNSVKRLVIVAHPLAFGHFAKIASRLSVSGEYAVDMLTLREQHSESAINSAPISGTHFSFERFYKDASLKADRSWIHKTYPNIEWNALVAAERSFTDYSFLFGAIGHRPENSDYTEKLVLGLAGFFHSFLTEHKADAFLGAYGDNLFSLIAGKIAEARSVPSIIPQHSFINEDGIIEKSYFGRDTYLHCYAMIDKYIELQSRQLTQGEQRRVRNYKAVLASYEPSQTMKHIFPKSDHKSPISPITLNPSKIFEGMGSSAEVLFYKRSIKRKFAANILRLFRSMRARRFIYSLPTDLPERFVLLPLQHQPEATTLVNGIWYSNQICLVEQLSKALPLGYELVVKEHPRSIGQRPIWQYKHIQSLHNVVISNIDSKYLCSLSDLVVTVSGSIALEATALAKPVMLLGKCVHDYNKLFYRVGSFEEMSATLFRILIHRDFYQNPDLVEDIDKFLLSYISPMKPYFLSDASIESFSHDVLDELARDYANVEGHLLGEMRGSRDHAFRKLKTHHPDKPRE